ncbi:MAG: hypothetical protein EZS28_038894, partial [Streblomastix strix]
MFNVRHKIGFGDNFFFFLKSIQEKNRIRRDPKRSNLCFCQRQCSGIQADKKTFIGQIDDILRQFNIIDERLMISYQKDRLNANIFRKTKTPSIEGVYHSNGTIRTGQFQLRANLSVVNFVHAVLLINRVQKSEKWANKCPTQKIRVAKRFQATVVTRLIRAKQEIMTTILQIPTPNKTVNPKSNNGQTNQTQKSSRVFSIFFTSQICFRCVAVIQVQAIKSQGDNGQQKRGPKSTIFGMDQNPQFYCLFASQGCKRKNREFVKKGLQTDLPLNPVRNFRPSQSLQKRETKGKSMSKTSSGDQPFTRNDILIDVMTKLDFTNHIRKSGKGIIPQTGQIEKVRRSTDATNPFIGIDKTLNQRPNLLSIGLGTQNILSPGHNDEVIFLGKSRPHR